MKQLLTLFTALLFFVILNAQELSSSIIMSKKSVTKSIEVLSARLTKSTAGKFSGVQVNVKNISNDLIMSRISIHFRFYEASNKLIKDSVINWEYIQSPSDIYYGEVVENTRDGRKEFIMPLDSNAELDRVYVDKFYKELIDNNRKKTISINYIPAKTKKIIYLISSVTHSEVEAKGLLIHSYSYYAPGY